MNHQMPPMQPYGQPPHMPPSRRQHGQYPQVPPDMRHHGYQGGVPYPYWAPHMGPIPYPPPQPYPQYYQPYPPPPPQHRPYQGPSPQQQAPYAPLIVSSTYGQQAPPTPVYYPPSMTPSQSSPRPISPHVPGSAHIDTQSPIPQPPLQSHTPVSQLPQPPSTVVTNSTPLESPFSPPPPSTPSSVNLPWMSVDDPSFPSRAPKTRRHALRRFSISKPVEFPLKESFQKPEPVQLFAEKEESASETIPSPNLERPVTPVPMEATTPQPSETPSDLPSEATSTQPTTPSSAITPQASTPNQKTPTQMKTEPRQLRSVQPVVPVLPALPRASTMTKRTHRESLGNVSNASRVATGSDASDKDTSQSSTVSKPEAAMPNGGETAVSTTEETKPAPIPPPKSWADLVRKNAPSSTITAGNSPMPLQNGLGPAKNETLSDVLNTIDGSMAESSSRIAFLQPRGLVNTGNMCYMNSILQVLIFCLPFYEFLERIGRSSAHSFKSDTPLVDAMIEFMREFKVLFSAESVEQLRLRLRSEDIEDFGEAFIPEYVYQVIRQLPRFRDMRRGHQQDAQEFLGFLLEELHDECAHAMRSGSAMNSGTSTPMVKSADQAQLPNSEDGWQEVGHKQKPAVTRSSGIQSSESPITKIFGGKLRSELKVPGNKNSVTLEPFEPLQLDIGSPQINNITDALKGLTRPENIQGDFKSPRGAKATTTKQVFIESLPPVLVLHLKRFHYDNNTKRTEKIWKKVGYPLDLEIPREVFPPQSRNKMSAHGGFPKYRLMGVIYHHGKHASGGHYTVDVRRQDGLEWIRLDDTIIRRIRSQDVAEAGSEEDPKILAAALKAHEQQKFNKANIYEEFDENEDDNAEKGWSQVNGPASQHSRNKSSMANIANGTLTPTTTKTSSGKQTPVSPNFGSIQDNKVAYLLFYQRVRA
ncbi:MAG: hypothetical protein Q9227_004544 [Pyrenula ochraceoflavens]